MSNTFWLYLAILGTVFSAIMLGKDLNSSIPLSIFDGVCLLLNGFWVWFWLYREDDKTNGS